MFKEDIMLINYHCFLNVGMMYGFWPSTMGMPKPTIKELKNSFVSFEVCFT
jgi:hypothetical protein